MPQTVSESITKQRHPQRRCRGSTTATMVSLAMLFRGSSICGGSVSAFTSRAYNKASRPSMNLQRVVGRSHATRFWWIHNDPTKTKTAYLKPNFASHPPKKFSSTPLGVAMEYDHEVEEEEDDNDIKEEIYLDNVSDATLVLAPFTTNRDMDHCKSAFEVTAPFAPQGDQPEAIEELVKRLQERDRFSVLQGITGTGKTLVMSHVIARHGRPTLVLCHNKTLAAQLARELRSFLGKNAVELFVSYYNHYVPESYNEATGSYNSKKSSINHDIDAMRHRATRALITRDDVVIVASVSCIYGLGLPEEYLDATQTIAVGDVVGSTSEDFFAILDGMLYQKENNDDDFARGKYQVMDLGNDRCDITLWPPHESFPLRIELEQKDGQDKSSPNMWTITSIEQGHAAGHDPIPSTRLFPAKHHVMSEDRIEDACLAIEEECEHRVKELNAEGKYEEASRLQKRVFNDVLMLRETGYCSGAENYSRHMAGRAEGQPPSTLMDYLSLQGREWLLMMDESHVTLPQLRAMYGGDRSRKERLVKHGYRLPSALDNRPLKEEEFWERVQQTVFISATPSQKELNLSARDAVEMVIRPTHVCDPVIEVKPRDGQLQDLIKEVEARSKRKERTLAVALTKRDAEDLADFLNENGVPASFIHSGLNTQERADALKSLQSGQVNCLVGVNLLREGLDLPQVSLVAILNADSEGFLRSETALLQMVGRAARNIQGAAIFYANRVTQSMKDCMEATNSRRMKQLAYNREHAVQMKSTKGSSMLSIFDLLKDQIAEEQPLEVIGRKGGSSRKYGAISSEKETPNPDVTVHVASSSDVKIDHLPSKPGCYMWIDSDGSILYIGKAKRLRSRIRSYVATNAKHTKRIQVMLEKAARVDIILTGSDREALLLESNLIKHHQPPYNVLLKDDHSYPYICASVGDRFPRFYPVPRRHEGTQSARKYRYFGPYPHYKEINAILVGIEEKYDLRAKSLMARHESAEITKEDYNKLFQKALDETFSPGGSGDTTNISELAKMRSEFEEAGVLFDSDIQCSRDVVALATIPGQDDIATSALVHVVQFRNGLIARRFSYEVELASGISSEEDRSSLIGHVLERRHYPSGEESVDDSFSFFPDEVLVQHLPDDTKDLKHALRSSRRKVEEAEQQQQQQQQRSGQDKKVAVRVRTIATRGKRKESDQRAMKLVIENAEQVALERSMENVAGEAVKTSVDGTALDELADLLKLDQKPSRIECYDVSHNQGDFPVASRVVFEDGKPRRDLYRRFNIRSVDGPDDYASLEETLSRRFRHAWVNCEGGLVSDNDPWSLPDVVLIDGGIGQLNAAAKGMAKARVFPADNNASESHYTLESPPHRPVMGKCRSATVAVCSLAKKSEELFVYGEKNPVNETPDSPALLLLRALRDESHRFALQSHRRRRSVTKSPS